MTCTLAWFELVVILILACCVVALLVLCSKG